MEDDDNAVATFCAFTGASAEQAQTFLQLADGNMEAAVGLFMEHGNDGVSMEQQQRALDRQQNAATTTSTNPRPIPISGGSDSEEDVPRTVAATSSFSPQADDYRAPIAPRREVLIGGMDDGMGGGGYMGSHPYQGDFNPFEGMFGVGRGAMPVRRDPFQLDPDEELGQDEASGTRRRLADLFAPPRAIMYQGTFERAREDAREQKKWFMVTLHDPTEFPCQTMNRDLWKDSSVQEVIKSSFLFVQYQVDSAEGKRYQTFYPTETVPHIAIIDPRTGERVKVWSIAPSSEEFLLEVMDFLESNSLTGKKTSSAKRVYEMTEEEQLAAALAASAAETAESASTSAAVTAVSPSQAATPTQEDDPVASIPAKEHSDPPAGTPAAQLTTLQFRSPEGKRIVKKFRKSEKVRVLFEHVKAVLPETQSQPIELYCQRDALSAKLDVSLEEAGVVAAAVNVHFK